MVLTASLLIGLSLLWLWWGEVSLPPWSLDVSTILQAGLLSIVILSLSQILYRSWPAYQGYADTYMQLVVKPLIWSDLLLLGILPGLSEELLFRGVILSALGMSWPVILISNLLFGGLHLLEWKSWPYGLWAMVVGTLMALGLILTGNLAVPVLAHMCTNTCSGLFWKWDQVRRQQ
jgi:hypothetical protein